MLQQHAYIFKLIAPALCRLLVFDGLHTASAVGTSPLLRPGRNGHNCSVLLYAKRRQGEEATAFADHADIPARLQACDFYDAGSRCSRSAWGFNSSRR